MCLGVCANACKPSVTGLFVLRSIQSQQSCVHNTHHSLLQYPSLLLEDMAGVKQLFSLVLLPAVQAHTHTHTHA